MKSEINKCIEVLDKGGIILYPTDTVWGIGCDATNQEAVDKIFELKKRSDSKSLIVLVNNDAMLNKHVQEVPEIAWDLIDLSTKPTTIVYPQARNLAKNVYAEDGSIAIRMIKTDFCNQLLYKFRKPIVSTSANISGSVTPKNFQSIVNEVKSQVDYIVNEQFDVGIKSASSIIKIEMNGEIKIIRK